jgi:hypothetical protein
MVRDQVSHPYKTIGKAIVLYISLFIFLDMEPEDKRFWAEWCQAFSELILSMQWNVIQTVDFIVFISRAV